MLCVGLDQYVSHTPIRLLIHYTKKKLPCSLYKRDIMVQYVKKRPDITYTNYIMVRFVEKRHDITYTNYKLYKKTRNP